MNTTSTICTTCGTVVSGGHPASCNSPTQRFVTPAEWAEMKKGRRIAVPTVSREEFRRQREHARRSQRPSAFDGEIIAERRSPLGNTPEYKWLLPRCHIGPNTRAARLTLAALIDPDDHQASPEAVEWLVSVVDGRTQSSKHAAELLRTVAFPVHEHGLLVDEGVAKLHARNLKLEGYLGVRVVQVPLGFLVRSQGLLESAS